MMIFPAVHKRAIQEATEILSFANTLAAITGEPSNRCLEFAKSIPPGFRVDVTLAACEGMGLDKVEAIFGNTFLSAAWRLDLAGRDFCRAVVGAPTVHDMLTPDDLGCLTELNTEILEGMK